MSLAGKLRGRLWRHATPLLERGFAPRLDHDPKAPPLLLSPHLDDAVIDCWSVITAEGTLNVVNVFAGVPPAGRATRWDRIVGAADSAELMRTRIAEDREALGRAGRSPVNLDFLAHQHREDRRPPRLAAIDAELTHAAPAASRVYAPAALGTPHPDHVRVRDYALACARAGVPVELYADLPYAVVYGWPHWVTGDPPDPNLDVDAYWGDDTPAGEPRVVQLEHEEAAAKLEAMRVYATQFPSLDRGPIGLLRNPKVHPFEVFWACESS
jgi:LmbE family N-acetylglucosaminyl deacetylase